MSDDDYLNGPKDTVLENAETEHFAKNALLNAVEKHPTLQQIHGVVVEHEASATLLGELEKFCSTFYHKGKGWEDVVNNIDTRADLYKTFFTKTGHANVGQDWNRLSPRISALLDKKKLQECAKNFAEYPSVNRVAVHDYNSAIEQRQKLRVKLQQEYGVSIAELTPAHMEKINGLGYLSDAQKAALKAVAEKNAVASTVVPRVSFFTRISTYIENVLDKAFGGSTSKAAAQSVTQTPPAPGSSPVAEPVVEKVDVAPVITPVPQPVATVIESSPVAAIATQAENIAAAAIEAPALPPLKAFFPRSAMHPFTGKAPFPIPFTLKKLPLGLPPASPALVEAAGEVPPHSPILSFLSEKPVLALPPGPTASTVATVAEEVAHPALPPLEMFLSPAKKHPIVGKLSIIAPQQINQQPIETPTSSTIETLPTASGSWVQNVEKGAEEVAQGGWLKKNKAPVAVGALAVLAAGYWATHIKQKRETAVEPTTQVAP